MALAKDAALIVRINPEIKSGAKRLFSAFGIKAPDAANMFLRQSLLIGALPFELRHPGCSAETEAAMQEAHDVASVKIQAKACRSIDEMNAGLGSGAG
jgi:DNA-damage-inducible protein J